MTEYRVFARIPVKPEHLDDAKQAVLAITPATLAEEGCLCFDLHESTDEESTLFLYEVWRDEAAFAYHHAQDYTKDVFEKYKQWLRDEVKITPLRKLT